MGKLILFIVILVIIGSLVWLVKDLFKPKSDKPLNANSEIKKLKLKILQEKSRVQEGIEGAEKPVKKYTKQLLDLEEINNKIKK